MRLLTLTACTFSLTFASMANAQPRTTPTADDERCLLEMVALSNATDPNAQKAGQGGVAYFVGRITAREPNFDFARLKQVAQTMEDKAADAELQQRCGPLFQKSMQSLATALSAPAPSSGSPAPK